MNYIIMHETVTNHDAIGNDIEAMFVILSKKHKCSVFAVNRFNQSVQYIDEKKLNELIGKEDSVLIYHHSVYWEYGFKVLQAARCRVIIRYHNITPSAFFQKYSDFHFSQCDKGRKQTEEMVQKLSGAYWLCDSRYNASEIHLPECKIGICPPFNKIEEWAKVKPNESILKKLVDSDKLNLLFVGRVAPNKGHLQALEVLRYYCRCYDKNIKLRVIGKFDDGIAGYNEIIKNYIVKYRLTDNVEFIGETTDSDLMSYYLGSDLMLCYSQHEGFCVPVIEAQYFGLPVIALAATAVPETIGKNQICLQDDKRLFAAAIRVLSGNEMFMKYLRKEGFENYHSRFSYPMIEKAFLSELERGCKEA